MPAMSATTYYGIGPNGAKPDALMVIERGGRNVWVLNRLDHVWEERPDAVRYVFDAGAVSPDVLTEISAETSAALATEFSSPPWSATASALEFGDVPGHEFHGNQWTDGGGLGKEPGTQGGSGTKDDPYKVNSANRAAELMLDGKFVALPPEKLSILLDKLAAIGKDAKEKGEKAPVYDLCKITIPDSNLFCSESLGIERIEMPQLGGMNPEKGTIADTWERDAKGEVNGSDAFREQLAADGIKVESASVPAVYLKATQNELNGAKVAGMEKALDAGTLPNGRIYVSSDNYVLDGHHRWAANVGHDYEDGKGGDVSMDVYKVDMPISVLLGYTNDWTEKVGLKPAGVAAALRAALMR